MSLFKSNLGGGIPGVMPKQTINTNRDSDVPQMRSVLRRAWNQEYARGNVNGYGRAIGEFKAVTNIGDYLSRKNYVCGNIPNPTQPDRVQWRSRIGSIIQNCDCTNIPASNSNNKFVPDSSEYTKYRKQRVSNLLYNDSSTGGDDHNGSYVALRMSKST